MAKKCESTCPDSGGGPDYICELLEGHGEPRNSRPPGVKWSQKHRDGGVAWTDGGAAQLREQLEKKRIQEEAF